MYEATGDLELNRVTNVGSTLVRREVRDRCNPLPSADTNRLEHAFVNIKKNRCNCHAINWLVVSSLKFWSIMYEEADRAAFASSP